MKGRIFRTQELDEKTWKRPDGFLDEIATHPGTGEAIVFNAPKALIGIFDVVLTRAEQTSERQAIASVFAEQRKNFQNYIELHKNLGEAAINYYGFKDETKNQLQLSYNRTLEHTQ